MDWYAKTSAKNPYDYRQLTPGEPDLRHELRRILYEEGRGSYFIYRRARRDTAGKPILAESTISNRSAEATFGTNKGMKYLFDDYLVTGYLSEGTTFHDTGTVKSYGDSRTDKITLFLEYDVLFKKTNNTKDLPDTFDKILVPEIDINGNLTSPLKCSTKYDLGSPEPYRLNSHGRVEFFRLNLISNMDDSFQL
jgi:hypothetical protein